MLLKKQQQKNEEITFNLSFIERWFEKLYN